MSGDFWLGLAVLPALALALTGALALRNFVRYRIRRLGGFNPHRSIPLAARLAVARRAFVWSTPSVAIALVFGSNYADHQRAEAVLLDEFLPLKDGDER